MNHATIKKYGLAKPPRRKLLIVSSYRRECGIAQYVEHLEVPLRANADWDVEIAPLPVHLLRSRLRFGRRLARTSIAAIVEQAASADVVNIQLEPGLYGSDPWKMWRRLKAIIRAAPRVIITYHSVPNFSDTRISYLSLRRDIVESLHQYFRNLIFTKLFKEVRRTPDKFRHIVHTPREAVLFRLLGIPPNTIADAPLAFLTREAKAQHEGAVSRDRDDIIGRIAVPDARLIGCFGFLSEYKGIEVAIKAMQFLPENWHLLVVGGLHPESVTQRKVDQPYLADLLELVRPTYDNPGRADTYELLKTMSRRIHFYGGLSNDAFAKVMNGCDAVLLPYAEVGQTSSGPASMALDLGKPVYCSRNEAFKELNGYVPGTVSFFEIGNYVELAQKLVCGDGDTRLAIRRAFSQRFNVERRALIYLGMCNELVGAGAQEHFSTDVGLPDLAGSLADRGYAP